MRTIKYLLAVALAIVAAGCASSPDERHIFTDIDELIEEAAWETIAILEETIELNPDLASSILAVYYFTEENEKSSASDYLIQGLTTEIANAIRYEEMDIIIVSRRNLDRIIEELAFQATDLADQDTQISIGKQLGADIILTGTITPFSEKLPASRNMMMRDISHTGTITPLSDMYKLNAQLLEIETGAVLGGYILSFSDESGF